MGGALPLFPFRNELPTLEAAKLGIPSIVERHSIIAYRKHLQE
jgi:hypothetical protein